MQYLLGLMIVVFFGSGVLFLVVFVRELGRKLRCHRRLERTEGTVVSVLKKMAPRTPGHKRWRQAWMFFPVITFTPPSGTAVTFTSEMGDGGQVSRYEVGQRLPVRYDPAGEIPPILDSWAALWMPPLLGIFAGLVFILGSLLTYWAFGDRVFGRS